MRRFAPLTVCLMLVALLGRWQAEHGEPLELQLKVTSGNRCVLILKVLETSEGADYHAQLPEVLAGGSGHLSADELQEFKRGLDSHNAWARQSQPTKSDKVLVMLHQGERNHRFTASARHNRGLGEWLFAPKGLVEKCLENAFLCPD